MEKIELNGVISVNSYIIAHNNKCFIVDPGYEQDKIKEYVSSKGYRVLGILLTHGHLDHIGAIDCFNVPVYVYEKELKIVVNNDLNGFNTLNIHNNLNYDLINFVVFNDDSKIMIDNKKINFIHTPGHTIGGVCYIFDFDVYTGDTLFKGSVGRHDFPTGDVEMLKNSVVLLLDSLDDSYYIHPGHGDSTTVLAEKKTNPFYKMWKKEIK